MNDNIPLPFFCVLPRADFDGDEYLSRADLSSVVCRLVGGRGCDSPAALAGTNNILTEQDVNVLVSKLLEEVPHVLPKGHSVGCLFCFCNHCIVITVVLYCWQIDRVSASSVIWKPNKVIIIVLINITIQNFYLFTPSPVILRCSFNTKPKLFCGSKN